MILKHAVGTGVAVAQDANVTKVGGAYFFSPINVPSVEIQ
jgi:hypothetical protein